MRATLASSGGPSSTACGACTASGSLRAQMLALEIVNILRFGRPRRRRGRKTAHEDGMRSAIATLAVDFGSWMAAQPASANKSELAKTSRLGVKRLNA
jgi:hypothetical protein